MENENITLKLPNIFSKIPKHKWAIITYMLIIVVILLLLEYVPINNTTGNVISRETISEKNLEPLITNFINTELIPEGGAVISNIREESGIYVATITIDGQSIPTYFTKDGKFITQGTSLINVDNPINKLEYN